jgi:hypothetical protein
MIRRLPTNSHIMWTSPDRSATYAPTIGAVTSVELIQARGGRGRGNENRIPSRFQVQSKVQAGFLKVQGAICSNQTTSRTVPKDDAKNHFVPLSHPCPYRAICDCPKGFIGPPFDSENYSDSPQSLSNSLPYLERN